MDETFTFYGNPAGHPGNQESFDGGDGNDTLEAFFDGETAGASILTEFTEHADGTFTARYYSTQNHDPSEDSVTITNIENVHIVLRNAYGSDPVWQAPSRDVIRTGHGDDHIETRGGNDRIDSGRGVDYVDGGGGGGDEFSDSDVISKDFSDVSVDISWNIQTGSFSGPGTFLDLEAFGVLQTGSGNDTIVSSSLGNNSALPGNETILTGAGDDTVTVANGIDHVEMGTGNDRLIVDYRNALTPGTVNSILNQNVDGSYSGEHRGVWNSGTQTGVTFEDVEHFTIYSAGSSDNLVTGDGDDVVWGGAGNDRIDVGKGIDEADGGGGDQFADADSISKDFSDVSADISWDLQADTFSGPGSFTDFEAFGLLVTGSGNDTIVSGTLSNGSGLPGNEVVHTGAGNDTVTVANAVDHVEMGDGDDRLIVDYRNANFPGTITSILNENPDGSYSGEHRGSASGGTRTGVTFEDVEHFTIFGAASSDNLMTGDGDDYVSGGGGLDRIDVGKGVDHVDGDGHGLSVTGDSVSKDFSDVATDIVWNIQTNEFSGPGSFVNLEAFGTLVTGSGNDTIVTSRLSNGSGLPGNETIFTGGGDDVVSVFYANDIVDMGAGSDRLIVDYAAFQSAGNIVMTLNETSPGTYSGFVDPAGSSTDVTFAGVEHFTIRLQGGHDTILTGNGDDIISTDVGNDTVNAGGGNDYIEGGGGDDTINGGEGDDYIDGGAHRDTMTGGTGRDTLSYATATAGVTISLALTSAQDTGGSGSDTVSGFEDLVGSSHDDRLTGAAGANAISGGAGDDYVDGGDGDDTLDGGEGSDTLGYASAVSAVRVSLALAGPQATGGAGTDAFTGFENLGGSDHGDTLTGNADPNGVSGGAGDDALYGGGGDDTLDGGTGVDRLEGGAGNDVYIVDDAGDVVIEAVGEGERDAVRTALTTYVLPENVEILTLTGTTTGPRDVRGNGGDNTIDGSSSNDFMRLQDGGGDDVEGGDGFDQVALQGDYSGGLTLGTGALAGVEVLAILSGFDDRFGDTGASAYDYVLAAVDANVAAGERLFVDAAQLAAGEDLTFDGSAETDGSFYIFAGKGVDDLTGGAQLDVFLFRSDGRFTADDRVDGGGGSDQLALRGDYSTQIVMQADTMTNIEVLAILSGNNEWYGPNAGNFSYNLRMHDGNVVAGQTLTVDAAQLHAGEALILDGSQELDGNFKMYGGDGNDVLIGGAGVDTITGRGGADTLAGNGGDDIFRYRSASDTAMDAQDSIISFFAGDIIDLSEIDANVNDAPNSTFSFIGADVFSGRAGELRVVNIDGQNWVVQADIDGDGAADMQISVVTADADPITAVDFVL